MEERESSIPYGSEDCRFMGLEISEKHKNISSLLQHPSPCTQSAAPYAFCFQICDSHPPFYKLWIFPLSKHRFYPCPIPPGKFLSCECPRLLKNVETPWFILFLYCYLEFLTHHSRPLIQAGFCFVPTILLSSAAGGRLGSVAPLLGAGVVLRKGALGNPFPSLGEAQVIWSYGGGCVTWHSFSGVTRFSWVHLSFCSAWDCQQAIFQQASNKHLIPAAFVPVAPSCCCVSQSALTDGCPGRVFQWGLAVRAVGSRRGA